MDWSILLPVVILSLPLVGQILGNRMPLRADPGAKVSNPFGD